MFFDREADFTVSYMKFRLYPGQSSIDGWGNLKLIETELRPGMPIDEFTSLLQTENLGAKETDYNFGDIRMFLVGSAESCFETTGSDTVLHAVFLE